MKRESYSNWLLWACALFGLGVILYINITAFSMMLGISFF